ncbi:DUF4406 domain-containing protein [Alkalibacter sp. M17DMB]|nr:DUF4406 domain-containing protein [Alkalibacter mobilis]
MNKIYIAGKITGDSNYRKKFNAKAKELEDLGYVVLNPAILPDGFDYEEYMHICLAMLDVCDTVYFLEDFSKSPGALREQIKAVQEDKTRVYFGRFGIKNDYEIDLEDVE